MRTTFLILLILTCIQACGCQSVMPRKIFRHHTEKLPPEDPWVEETGKITRAEFTPEEVPDPLKIRKYFVSETAMSIERNLGVGD